MNRNQRRVFVIHQVKRHIPGHLEIWENKYDYSLAEDYGRLVYVLQTEDFLKEPELFMKILYDKLKDFHNRDSILCTGDPLALIAAGMVLARANNWSRVRVLRWNGHRKRYSSFDIRAAAFEGLEGL